MEEGSIVSSPRETGAEMDTTSGLPPFNGPVFKNPVSSAREVYCASGETPHDRRYRDLAHGVGSSSDSELLARLSIDQLRELATRLGISDVRTITESDDLIQAIVCRLRKS